MRRIRPWIVGALCAVILTISSPDRLLAATQPAQGVNEGTTPIGWIHLLFDHLSAWGWWFSDADQPSGNHAPQVKKDGASTSSGGISITPLNTATTGDPATTQVGVVLDPDG